MSDPVFFIPSTNRRFFSHTLALKHAEEEARRLNGRVEIFELSTIVEVAPPELPPVKITDVSARKRLYVVQWLSGETWENERTFHTKREAENHIAKGFEKNPLYQNLRHRIVEEEGVPV